jgi:hypothetical protein
MARKKATKKSHKKNKSLFKTEHYFYILYVLVLTFFSVSIIVNMMTTPAKAEIGRDTFCGEMITEGCCCDNCCLVEDEDDDDDGSVENATFNGSNSSEPRDNTSCSTAITTTTSTNGDVKTFTYELTPDSDGQAWAYLKGTNPTGVGTKLLYLGDESGAASNVYQCNKWGGSIDKLTYENFTQVCVKFGSTLQCG